MVRLRRYFLDWPRSMYFRLSPVLRDPFHRIALCIFLLSFLVYFLYASFRYYAFRTLDFDLGIYSQSLSSTLQGKFLYSTVDSWYSQNGSLFAQHFSPIILALLPLYAAFPTPETLLAVQALAVAGASLPLYLLARKSTGSPPIGCALALVWVLSPATQSLAWYDFHIEALLPFFAFLGFYYIQGKRWAKALAAFMLGNLTIEFAPIIFVFVGLYMGSIALLPTIRRLPRDSGLLRFSLVLVAESIVAFGVADLVINYYGSKAAVTRYWSVLGSGFFGILMGVFEPRVSVVALNIDFASKVFFFLVLVLPFTLILLIEPLSLVMQVPILLAAGLASIPGLYALGFQYAGAFSLPFLLVGILKGLQGLHPRVVKVTLRTALAWSIILGLALSPLNPLTSSGPLLGSAYNRTPVDEHTILLHQAVGLVSSSGSVLAQGDIFPYFSDRLNAYNWLPKGFTPDFIVADTKLPLYESPIAGSTIAEDIQTLRANYTYGFFVNTDGIVILAKDYTGRPLMSGDYRAIFDYRDFQIWSGVLVQDATSATSVVVLHSWYDKPGSVWLGPNIGLPPGNYSVDFNLKPETDNTTVHLVVSVGQVTLTDKVVPATSLQSLAWQRVSLTFAQRDFLNGYQFQVFCQSGSLEVESVELNGTHTG